MRLYKDSIASKMKMRENKLADIEEALELYNDVARGWLMRAVKKPLIAMLQDPNKNLDFSEKN